MRTITRQELLNDSARILRQAEAGEVLPSPSTVDPLPPLGPYRRRQWVPAAAIAEIFATSTDEDVVGELRSVGSRDFKDPWQR